MPQDGCDLLKKVRHQPTLATGQRWGVGFAAQAKQRDLLDLCWYLYPLKNPRDVFAPGLEFPGIANRAYPVNLHPSMAECAPDVSYLDGRRLCRARIPSHH